MKPKLKPPGTKRLKLKCDILLSTSAFKFNLRRYIVPFAGVGAEDAFDIVLDGRALHSPTFQLILSRSGH